MSTYIVTTKAPKVVGKSNSVRCTLAEAASVHNKKLIERSKEAIARFYGISASLADEKQLIKFQLEDSFHSFIDVKSDKRLIQFAPTTADNHENEVVIETAYMTWDGKK